MAEKTVLKLLLSKWGVLSVEMEQAIKSDSAVLGENNSVRYVDNEEDAIDLEKAADVAQKFADFDDVTDKNEDKK